MNMQSTPIAARLHTDDLATAAREGVARALAARQRMTELSAEQTTQVSGGLTFANATLLGTQVVPRWWIYGQPAFERLTQPEITQGLNQVTFR